MNIAVCTLFEGDYHLGAAALLNSLHRAGFSGTVVCGHRGSRPAWADRTAGLAPIRLVWVAVSVPVHLTCHKAVFMLDCLQTHAPEAGTIAYFDPDIVVKAPWPVFARWFRNGGVALCEDVNASLPSGHPYRLAWHDFFARHDLAAHRNLERYYNAGFIAVSRRQAGLLVCWETLLRLAQKDCGAVLGEIVRGRPETLFHVVDQDALNMALLLHPALINGAGGEAMDFLPGGHLLSHAAGVRKPWRGGFLREAIRGRPPVTAQKQFHHYADAPLPVLSAGTLAWRRFELGTAALLGRFYRRS